MFLKVKVTPFGLNKKSLVSLVFALIFSGSLVAINTNLVKAQTERTELEYTLFSPYYDPKEVAECYGTTSVEGLSSFIPDPWRSLIAATAPSYPDADPRLVAATLWAENRGWPEYKESGWPTSGAGAQGPWQFIDSTWASMGHDGDGDGSKDRGNPKDAVHAAFKHQAGSMGKPILIGYNNNPRQAYESLTFYNYTAPSNQWSLMTYMGKYNGSGVPNNTTLSNFPRGENSDYVKMGFWLISSDFQKGWMPGSDQFVDAASSGALEDSTQQEIASSSSDCVTTGEQGTVSPDGYSFPINATKSTVYAGWPLPCEGSSCHHDGTPAFDLSISNDDNSAGVAVYAITAGTIVNFKNSYAGIAGCQTFQLQGDDGWFYWYGHIQGVNKAGQRVSAGEQVAIIGERKCTGNGSYPHLHIDRGEPKGAQGGYVCCRSPTFIPLINSLYQGLPQ